MATHEAPRVEVPKPHMFSGKQDAMAVAESLMDYKESMSSNDEGSRVSHSSGGGEEVSPKGSKDDCSTNGGKEVPRSTARHGKGKVSYTRKDKGKRKQWESTLKLKCFLCDGPQQGNVLRGKHPIPLSRKVRRRWRMHAWVQYR